MDSATLLAKLQVLEARLSETSGLLARARAAAITGAIARYRTEGARHIAEIQRTSEELRNAVIGSDGLGHEVDSLMELALRSIRAALLGTFDELAAIIDDARMSLMLPAFQGAFFSCNALREFVDFQLAWQIRDWNAKRPALRADRPMYRALLRRANASLIAVRARLMPLIDEGVARTEWPELAAICARMRDLLGLRIEVEPDQAVMTFVHPAGGTRRPE